MLHFWAQEPVAGHAYENLVLISGNQNKIVRNMEYAKAFAASV
jgi:hypothetical protein